jgi:hypothetical protein
MEWAGHVLKIEKDKNAYNIFDWDSGRRENTQDLGVDRNKIF